MRIDRREVLSGALAASALAACHQTPPLNPVIPALSDAARRLQPAASAFGAALLAELMRETPKSTIVISPLSLMVALTMLGQGARGATAANLAEGLQLTAHGLDLASAAGACGNIAARLAASANADVAMANAVWVAPKAGLRPAFANIQQTAFGAKIATLDFDAPEAAPTINRFVRENTHGKIPSIVDPHDLLGVAIAVTDALYFKGGWKASFDPRLTQAAPFTKGDGEIAQTPLMFKGGMFQYAETGAFQSVVLNYADPRFTVTAVLPKPGASPDVWREALAAGHMTREGRVYLPRLNLGWSSKTLRDSLVSLGMGPAMSDDADYGLAIEVPTQSGPVIQRTLLTADEKGVEAAAATVVTREKINLMRPPPGEPFVFRADRPFYLALQADGGTPLFFAYVAAPTY